MAENYVPFTGWNDIPRSQTRSGNYQFVGNQFTVLNQSNMSDLFRALMMPQSVEPMRDETVVLNVNEKKWSGTNSSSMCAICQDQFDENDEYCELECSHLFHIHCLREEGYIRQACPVCRHPIDFTNG